MHMTAGCKGGRWKSRLRNAVPGVQTSRVLARWLDEGSTACGGTGEWWMLIEHDTGRYVTTAQSSRSEEEPIGSNSSLRNHD